MPMVELQNLLNKLVTDSPHLGRARGAPTSIDNPRGSRLSKKRFFETPKVEGTKRLHLGEGSRFARGRARGGSRGCRG
jgi:hypothetical protein